MYATNTTLAIRSETVRPTLLNLFTIQGKILPVVSTVFDLQVPKILGEVINKVPGYTGFDHNFCVNKGLKQELTFVARLIQHLLQFISNNNLILFIQGESS